MQLRQQTRILQKWHAKWQVATTGIRVIISNPQHFLPTIDVREADRRIALQNTAVSAMSHDTKASRFLLNSNV